MTTIDRSLNWMLRAHQFDDIDRKILLGLSHKKWKWHTLESLRSVTRLDFHDLTSRLTELLEDGLVAGSYIRETNEPIFALEERVFRKSERRPAKR